MAGYFGMGAILRPCLNTFILLLILGSPAIAQFCSFWSGSCLDALAQTAVSFNFPPLFEESLNLYYGFDANSRGKGQEPMTKVSFWLGYGALLNSSVITSNRTSEIALRVGNLTGTPSGSNNGCDGVWGPQCSYDLITLLKQALYGLTTSGNYYDDPLDTVLSEMLVNKPVLSNCPPPLFDVAAIPSISFAQETDTTRIATLQTSGSSSEPWKTWFIDNMTANDQAAQVAVAIISRAPSYDGHPPKYVDDIQVELVCTQAPSTGSSSSSQGS
ncbi:hypothetical protein AbraIFM66951_000863 [Aspergillus brasiliensis]|uniref:Heme haloperoxidase family profile domain-containing protein n=1 Tax=Aspergillus brasiliensis TaxID=319629 RepID=A0A9W6DK29_9EURO|nr:hypothetical protein AbraCBS73388_000873 [Aspergillus brasiliensis]GKZ42156.1 hypothetical protein AbraIFM66951_000863 [Aspergillus brasiliensis]